MDLDVDVRDLPIHLEVHETGATVLPARRNKPEPVYVPEVPVVETPVIETPVVTEPVYVPESRPVSSREPRPTMYVSGHELSEIERELQKELGAISDPSSTNDADIDTRTNYKPPTPTGLGPIDLDEEFLIDEVNDLFEEGSVPSQSYYDQDNWDVQGAA